MIFNLLFAVACGFVIGLERKFRNKAAGIKTIILITLGASLFTECSFLLNNSDPARIIGQIVTGIGFLGAGSIIRGEGDRISGLTTAAVIWVAAAIGVFCGMGLGFYALFVTGIVIIILLLVQLLENKLFPKQRKEDKIET